MTTPLAFERFRATACIVLSTFAAFLISFPLIIQLQQGLIAIPFTALGAIIGYRKRKSVFFFYFTLIAALLLLSLMISTLEQ